MSSYSELNGEIEVDVVLVQPAPNNTRGVLIQFNDDACRDIQVRPCATPRAPRPHWHPGMQCQEYCGQDSTAAPVTCVRAVTSVRRSRAGPPRQLEQNAEIEPVQ
jgi:hypothetical protein